MTEGVFGIVGCPIFEDEIVNILRGDETVERVFIVENESSMGIMTKMASNLRKPFESIPSEDVADLVASPGTVLLWMQDIGLHRYPEDLREGIIESLEVMDGVSSTILLFYGLCGNALKDIEGIDSMFDADIVILRGEDEDVVDDCIAAVIGGSRDYLRLIKDETGVMFMSPGWAEHWEDVITDDEQLIGTGLTRREYVRMLYEMAGYGKVLKIHTPIEDPESFDENVAEFAREFDFTIGEMEGNLDVIDRTYTKARRAYLDLL